MSSIPNRQIQYCLILIILTGFISDVFSQDTIQARTLSYTGSSTIGNFMADAEDVFDAYSFTLDTRPESAGGELAIVEGRTDLAGIARHPSISTLRNGIASTLIGWDAIAVIVHKDNPIKNLTQSQLKAIFKGEISNWQELGGPDMPLNSYIVGQESATRKIFRSVILGEDDYAGCKTISPDGDIPVTVENDIGGIGHISFSFLDSVTGIKPISVNGQVLSLTNQSYPIRRPLHLLWWPARNDVAAFVNWTLSPEGQRIVMKRFIGVRESNIQKSVMRGTLIVYTKTFPVEDGGVFYYPHKPYDLLSLSGDLIIHVSNHLSDNDENPAKLELEPGNYLIRTDGSEGETDEYFVSVESGQVTRLYTGEMTPEINMSETGVEERTEARNPREQESKIQSKVFTPFGDFRVRGEQDIKDQGNRFRGRFRIRIGMSARISPASKFELRLVSSNDPDDPNSTHVNLTDGFNQISVAIDRAYFHLKPSKAQYFQWWIGKFSNPVLSSDVFSELVWDADIQPEGTAISFTGRPFGNKVTLNVSNGTYLQSQFKIEDRKNWLNITQPSIIWQPSDDWSVSAASGFYFFANIKDQEINDPVLDLNEGNTTYEDRVIIDDDTIITTRYSNNFYLLDNFILLKYLNFKMPLIVKAQAIVNFGASAENKGFAAGLSYGDLKEKNEWKVYYQYHFISQDALFTPFAQDDALRKSNSSGHVLGAAYLPHKKISIHTWALLDKPAEGSGDLQTRLRLDLNFKF